MKNIKVFTKSLRDVDVDSILNRKYQLRMRQIYAPDSWKGSHDILILLIFIIYLDSCGLKHNSSGPKGMSWI